METFLELTMGFNPILTRL